MTVRFEEPDVAQVEALLGRMIGRKIAVVGDAMLDAYVIGEVGRISPEAPVPVLNVQREQFMLGGAANVAKCLVALGAKVRLCCLIGKDKDGDLFIEESKNLGIDATGVVRDQSRPTTRKTRIIARQQQVIRLDQEVAGDVKGTIEKRIVAKVEQAAKWADGVILSDYSKGVLTAAVCRAVIKAARGKPVVVDPKDLPWSRFERSTVIKPNLREARLFHDGPLANDGDAGKAANRMAKALNVSHVLLTRGGAGMTLSAANSGAVLSKNKTSSTNSAIHHFAAQQHDLIDVTGAGDVVAATLTLAMAAGADAPRATWLANIAAGVKVGKFGAAAVSGQELLEALGTADDDSAKKVLTSPQASTFAANARRKKRTVVFTNGCFDLLHVGHVNYLAASRKLGDFLIVGLNTDASVRRLKGEGRPVQSELDRAHILASLECVDAVVLFDQDTPRDLISAVKPDILTKGKDYKKKSAVVGHDIVAKYGGKVALIDLVEGKSTTKLIEKSKK